MQRKKENENKLRDVYNYINENKITTQNVHWDAKNLKRDETRNYNQQKKKFEIQQEKFLDLRRKKLSELLNGEEAHYHQELIDNQEKPEDVRKRMEAELKLLKAQRLNDRDTNVQKLQEKRFYDTTDELRKNDSEAFAVECYLEQENQMLDKLKRREKEKKEEMFYVKLNEFEIEKKKEKEKEEELAKKNKLKNIYDYQQWQREQNEKAIKHANEIKDLERKRLKEQWRRDEDKEKENEEQRKLINKQVYLDIEKFNQKEDEERKKKIEFEKKKDKELIESILAREKALDLIDKKEKEKKVKEFEQNKKYLEYVMNQKKEAEIWMDKIAQEEADKAYKKEQEEWLKEDAKRIAQLKDVYKGREQALLYQKKLKEDEKNAVLEERKQVDKAIDDYYNKIEEINKIEADKRKAHQNQLLYQIREKEDLRKRERQDVKYEERAAQLWEIEYQQKINEQKELHRQRLKAIREKNQEII
jgi:unconventional prefoldin RPB5 interactor 1